MNWFGNPARPRANVATGALNAIIGGFFTFTQLNELLSDSSPNRRLINVIMFVAAAVIMVSGIIQFRRGLRSPRIPAEPTPPDSGSVKGDHPRS